MPDLGVDLDESVAVAVPFDVGDDSARALWARDNAHSIAARHDPKVVDVESTSRFLARMQHVFQASQRAGFALFDVAAGAWAPMAVGIRRREPTSDELREMLRPPALLPPQVWLTPSTPNGVGCSSLYLVSNSEAYIRWVFVPTGHTIVATLGPVPSSRVVAFGLLAESIVASLRVDGVSGSASPSFDPEGEVALADIGAGPDPAEPGR